jgi:hypothetical protein
MKSEFAESLEGLRRLGWRIERPLESRSLPREVLIRYPWFPTDYREFVEETKTLASPDDKAWLLTASDFSLNSSDTAYAWNEWELQSLAAANDDEEWCAKIREFWDAHLPVLMSVKSGYAYLAIDKASLNIVAGEEPEYEDTAQIATSIEELFALIVNQDPRLKRWI